VTRALYPDGVNAQDPSDGSSSAWRALLGALGVSLVFASGGGAEAEIPQVEGPALTALAAGELGRSTHVAVGTVTALRDVRGMAIAHVAVERWLRGSYSAPTITVMVAGPRAALQAKSPSLPMLDRRSGVTYVLFLAQRADGEAFALENRQVIEGLEGLEKLRAVEAQVELAAIPAFEERARRVLQHYLKALESKGAWTRANAARELNHLALVRPEVFGESARARLSRAADAAAAPTVRSWLSILERRLAAFPVTSEARRPPETLLAPQPTLLGPLPTPEPAQRSPAPPEDAEQTLARLDARLLESGAEAPKVAMHVLRRLVEVRERVFVIDWLAAAGHAETLAGLRAFYAQEEEPDVRAAVIRAHGFLGGEADVPWLEARLSNARLVEAVLLTLARMRTPAARRALETFRAQRLSGGDDDQELARKVEHLLSPAFEEAERASGGRPAAVAPAAVPPAAVPPAAVPQGAGLTPR